MFGQYLFILARINAADKNIKQLAILYAYGAYAKYVVRYGKPGFIKEIMSL